MYRYLPVERDLFSPYIGPYHAFGLQVLHTHDERDEELMLLPDISTDFAFVLRLAHILTQKQLDPVHLLDVIEDSL